MHYTNENVVKSKNLSAARTHARDDVVFSATRCAGRADAMAALRRLLATFVCLTQPLLFSCTYASPSFRSEPFSTVQRQGAAVVLRCSVRQASAMLSWRFRGRPLEAGGELGGPHLGPGSLTLPSLQPGQTGAYQCVAHVGSRSIASRLAHVSIAGISEFDETIRRAVTVEEGGTVVIECKMPPSNPAALPRVRVRGEWLGQSTDDFLILPSGSLQIISASPQHQGTYKCGAYNPVTRELKSEAHGTKLTVKQRRAPSPVRIVYPVARQTLAVTQSEDLVLECALAGSPSPSARWSKDGEEVVLNAARRLLHNNLVLTGVGRSDEGIYQCSARTNTGEVVSATYAVTVLEPASVPQGLTDQSVPAGSSAVFTCVAKGNPAPNVTWLLNSAAITFSPHRHISDSSLHISDVTAEDQGIYQCLLDNGIGSAQSAAVLTVLPGPLASSSAFPAMSFPVSSSPLQNDEGEESFVQVEGPGNGEDAPTLGTNDLPTPEAPIITSPPQTHKHDVYDLEWRAGRDWGHPISAYFVRYRKLDDTGNVAGTWHTVRVPGSEKSLRLSDLEASSLYEVLMVARNEAGDGQPAMLTFRTGKERSTSSGKGPSKAPFLAQAEKIPEREMSNTHFGVVIHDRVPEAPDRPTVSMATESSVYVTWIPRANGGSPITAFRVEYRRQGRSSEWAVAADNISPLKLSVEVRSLEPGSTYRFRVVALNTYGESPHSSPSKPYQVSPASPPFPVRPVAGPHISSTDAVSDTQIMLRWTYTPSSNNNTPIQGFYIYYRPTDSDNDSDYKRDTVEGNRQWHLIGQLQPETSYDIKMQCFNDGGESEYSNVMICETKARQSPGMPPEDPITPPDPYLPAVSMPPGGLLYLIVGCVLGVMVLILLVFIAMCLWRNRQQGAMHKCDSPGYLFQPAEMNGHVMDYTSLPSSAHINGGVRGGYGHGGLLPTPSCPHLHHKVTNGMALFNGSGALYPTSHALNGPPPRSAPEYDHTHSHLQRSGGGMYTVLPQSESSDCMSCQNFCNNNRCYTKANGSFSGGSLPIMHHLTPPLQDGLELVPLSHVTSHCHNSDNQRRTGEEEAREPGEEPDGDCRVPPPSQHSCCQSGAKQHRSLDEGEEEVPFEGLDSQAMYWDRLDPPGLDCGGMGRVDVGSCPEDLVHPALQEL
uniref:Cell adhesion associated, oncogene regulated n=1 Tax=Scleropages formosus TaxID=113540 RepID=A0A8C9WSV9_SCLFO